MRDPVNIVLSSGPVGGKTRLIKYLQRALIDEGYQPFILPEIATMLEPTGIHPVHLPGLENETFQNVISSKYIHHWSEIESEIKELQQGGFMKKPPVILHDRGFVDQRVYCGSEEEYLRLRDKYLKDRVKSYNLVIHMMSLAVDKPDLYNKLRAENPARHEHEDVEFAINMDRQFVRVWRDAGIKVVTVPNDGDFDLKIRTGIKEALNYLKSL